MPRAPDVCPVSPAGAVPVRPGQYGLELGRLAGGQRRPPLHRPAIPPGDDTPVRSVPVPNPDKPSSVRGICVASVAISSLEL